MKYFIHLPMKMELIESSETSAIRTQTPGNYPKENMLLFNFVCLCIVFSFVGSDYCTDTVSCFCHTLTVFMVHFSVLCF